jgi:hypothetical protein
MADVFISYSSVDEELARFVHDHLQTEKVTSFMAAASLQPGDRWTKEVFSNLRLAKWVVFLASRTACSSAYVQQELGAAMIANKNLIPIVWDMAPHEVPGWVSQHHVLNLTGRTYDDLRTEVTQIAQRVRQDRTNGLLTVGAIALGLMALSK